MTIKYLKELKLKVKEDFLNQNQSFMFSKREEITLKKIAKQEKNWDKVVKITEQIDLGRLPKNSANDNFIDYLNGGGHNLISIFYMILAFLIYLPSAFFWLLNPVLKFLFSRASFYEYIIYLPVNIWNWLIIQQSYIYIYAMEIDGLNENDSKIFKNKSVEFAEYNIWEEFYQK